MRIVGHDVVPTRAEGRAGVVLTLHGDGGEVGEGEASPLPGYSPDTLEASRACLDGLSWAHDERLLGGEEPALEVVRRLTRKIPATLPSARFAFETALLELTGTELPPAHVPRAAALVRPGDVSAVLAFCRGALDRGVRCFKVKLRRLPEDLALIDELRRALPADVALWADANRSIPRTSLRAVLDALARSGVELFEEPAPPSDLRLELEGAGRPTVRIALDETLFGDGGVDELRSLAAQGIVGAVVLKPMTLGGALASMEIADVARKLGAKVVVSHSHDGPIARHAGRALAAAAGDPDLAHGAASWRDPLSIEDAAEEAPDRPALVAGDRVLTWSELAARVRAHDEALGPGPVPVVALPDVETLVRIHGLLARGIPMLLLHPRLAPPEQRAAIDRLATGAWTRSRAPEAPLAIFATSGTTGAPKGVILSRGAFAASARALAERLPFDHRDRWLLSIPPAHVGGFSILVRALVARMTVVLGEDLGAATITSFVPTQLERLVDRDPPPGLRVALVGGAAAPKPLLDEAAARGWPVVTTYGLTEACGPVTIDGRPLPGIDVQVAADDHILVRGPTLMTGYWPPGADPQPLADGWLDTGDLGRIDRDRGLEILGRSGDVIITGGENVYPADVEAAIRAVPGVAAALVEGAPDPTWGEIVTARIVLKPGAELTPPAIEQALRSTLASFKRPRCITIVEELPVGPTGKRPVTRARRSSSA